jgi:hypothetical protein
MHKRYATIFILVLAIFVKLNFSFGQISAYPQEITEALEKAGKNAAELEKVLSHYASPKDSLKWQAAFFLIGNMEGHSYTRFALYDTLKKEVEFNPLVYPTYEALQSAWDTLEQKYGTLDFKKKETFYDLDTISSDFLINQIDYAFRAWREKPWAKGISFEQFCEYILPYRGSNEPLELWRETFWEKYKELEKKIVHPEDPIEVAKLINDDIKSWFSFDPRFYYHPTDQGLSEMTANRKGRCEDMTNLTNLCHEGKRLSCYQRLHPLLGKFRKQPRLECHNNLCWQSHSLYGS